MNLDNEEHNSVACSRPRTFSNDSQKSQPSSKQNFPVLTSDSGLYTCSSNASDCSLQIESDTDSCHQYNKHRDGHFYTALKDMSKLRSELERLTKSEQWYKQELRLQKTIRLDDLERIYTQERKFLQENQRLQKECVRLYERCNALEREIETHKQESLEHHVQYINDKDNEEENVIGLEKEQQLSLIKGQQQLISVLRQQKRSLLEDIKCLTEERDEKVVSLQRLLADLEFDNKIITKKCSKFAKERLSLENDLKEGDNKLSTALQENMNLHKSIVDLKEQLDIQRQLVKLKESEVQQIQQHYTQKIQEEIDLDQVHSLSIKYQGEINGKTLEIINLKERLQQMQDELEDMRHLQEQNEEQQRQIEQLHFCIETYRIELQELKASQEHKNNQLHDLHAAIDQLIKDKEIVYKTSLEHQNEVSNVRQNLKSTQEKHAQLQELYKNTLFQLNLIELENGKAKFQNDRDQQEIQDLRNKLKEYYRQTTDLSVKIEHLENELSRLLEENLQLRGNSENIKMSSTISQKETEYQILSEEVLQHSAFVELNTNDNSAVNSSRQELSKSDKSSDDQDLIELQQECAIFEAKLDFIRETDVYLESNLNYESLKNFMKNTSYSQPKEKEISTCEVKSNRARSLEKDLDFFNVSMQGLKLQENIDKLNEFLKEKRDLLLRINSAQESNEDQRKLVKENEILKRKLSSAEEDTLMLQIKQDINEEVQKHLQLKESLENHMANVADLQQKLLKNDGKLYKLERMLKTQEKSDEEQDLKLENIELEDKLKIVQTTQVELKRQLVQETEQIQKLKQSLHEFKIEKNFKKHQAIQCVLAENSLESQCEVRTLKKYILELQQQQRILIEEDANKKKERLQFLHQLMNLQNDKMQNLYQQQKDWEDVLMSLNKAHAIEETTRKELKLKRLELEELNQVFEKQNEEFRKLEEFTALLELKMQQEKDEIKLIFQKDIDLMKQQLQDSQKEIENQRNLNRLLNQQCERFHLDGKEEYTTEVAAYKNEVRDLKSRVSIMKEEKENLLESLRQMEQHIKHLKDNKREAVLLPELSLFNGSDTSANNSIVNIEIIKKNVSEDHLRILTKVLESEYQRKMFRYDEHIHSLLNNLKIVKKSLKANEEKTAILSEEQHKAKEELKDLQKTKQSLHELRLKYAQSQNIIKELKHYLAVERKKFELSDSGKSTRTPIYEVSNLIDDYKKLIKQSVATTKRPSTSAIFDLMERSNQYVPNLETLGNNVEGLRSELNHFLSTYVNKIPSTALIAPASLSVPPSLMDELKAASEEL